VKVVCGLGNPGPAYAETRHNAGWWVVERAREAWRFPPLRGVGAARVSDGWRHGRRVVLIEPLTYMNRSGSVLAPLLAVDGFDVTRDLLVVVDDAALEPGRLRLRARGSSGGHNGLRSIEAALGTQAFARLRVGVGVPPAGADLSAWVLAPLPVADGERVRARLDAAVGAIDAWLEGGADAAVRALAGS
jgi:PTH1 family peptidyl-tRNA hydrolase